MQAVHGWLSTYERLVNSQNFFSPYLTQEDLSRFGREYAQMGMYIENDFEDWNIRFISIGENIDTLNGTDVILMPIINVINSHYPRTKCPNSQRTNRKNRSPRKRNNQWRKNQTVDMYYKFVGIW